MSYGKIFASMYTGSLVGSGPVVFALFPYIIANARPDEGSTIDLNPVLLAAIFGCPQDAVAAAIEFLCLPDEKSRTITESGCRLMRKGPMTYFVVNLEKYRFFQDRSKSYWTAYRQKRRS